MEGSYCNVCKDWGESKNRISAKLAKVPVRTMETDGFTDKKDWYAWLEQGESLLALAQALEDDMRISDCRPLLRTPCERTEEAKRLVEEAVSNLMQAANVFLSGISYESRMELSKCLAVICQIPDRDNAQMLANFPKKYFDVFERGGKIPRCQPPRWLKASSSITPLCVWKRRIWPWINHSFFVTHS